MNKYFIFFTLFISIGCSGKLHIESADASQKRTDLDQFLHTSNLSSEGSDAEELNTEAEDSAVQVASLDPCGEEIPEWTQELNQEVQFEQKGKGIQLKFKQNKSGKRKRKPTVDSDLIRSNCHKNTQKKSQSSHLVQSEHSNKNAGDGEASYSQEAVAVNDKMDLVIVLDNSSSMRHILKSNNTRFSRFLDSIKDLDWRIAFLDSNPKKNGKKQLMQLELDGALVISRRYITKGTQSKDQLFIDTLTRANRNFSCKFSPGCGSRFERTIGSLSQYLQYSKKPEIGSHFLRSDANLVVLIVTDNYENKTFKEHVTSQVFLDQFNDQFTNKKLTVYSLTTLSSECRSQLRKKAFVEGNFAPEVTLLTERTGGSNFSLCLKDYSVVGKAIAEKQLKL